jgi:REP element-mobilizing transposase RayT
MKRARQQELPFPSTWGGKRDRAGRKPKSARGNVPHLRRPEHNKRHPVHVTLRAVRRLPSLRKQVVCDEIRRAFPKTARSWFRVVHFSVQADHVHLLVEADDKVALARGLAGLSIRFARNVNRVLVRRGRLFSDRYHARSLRTPREVRHGLVYVLMNWKKHIANARGFDACSSAWWFDGWKVPPASGPPDFQAAGAPVEAPQMWLTKSGWRRHGLLARNESPKPSGRAIALEVPVHLTGN